jgi:hypothetical protein
VRITGADFLVLAADWDATHQGPPQIMGLLFHVFESPNRFGLPPFYTLHVWVWKHNPNATEDAKDTRVEFFPWCPLCLPKEAAADERRVGRLIAPPVEVMGWCRLPDWAASDAVKVHSKRGATVRCAGCSLAVL